MGRSSWLRDGGQARAVGFEGREQASAVGTEGRETGDGSTHGLWGPRDGAREGCKHGHRVTEGRRYGRW